MKVCLSKRFVFGCLCILYFPGSVLASSSDSSSIRWFESQIQQHPEVVAAREHKNAALSIAESYGKPLYNPEFETELEREGEADNYLLGISQTIDWRDKRDTRRQLASADRTIAEQTYESVVQQKSAEALQSLIGWEAASQLAELAVNQERQLGTLLELVKQRQQAGDVSQLDAEMTILGLSQTFSSTAQALSQLKKEEAHLRELLPEWSPEAVQVPEIAQFVVTTISNKPAQIGQWLNAHPLVMVSRAEWDASKQSAVLTNKEAKADPTVGINGGQSDKENVIALTFSIPLNVRNDFSAESKAASQEVSAAEAQYYATHRKQKFAIQAAYGTLQQYQKHSDRWQKLMQGRGKRSENLLKKQWISGDLSTTEYLLALQQLTEGLTAGIELLTQFQLARIEWLLQTGQINTALQSQ